MSNVWSETLENNNSQKKKRDTPERQLWISTVLITDNFEKEEGGNTFKWVNLKKDNAEKFGPDKGQIWSGNGQHDQPGKLGQHGQETWTVITVHQTDSSVQRDQKKGTWAVSTVNKTDLKVNTVKTTRGD